MKTMRGKEPRHRRRRILGPWRAAFAAVCAALCLIPASGAQAGEIHALLIAVDEYQFPEWRRLPGVRNDHELWRDLLMRRGAKPRNIVSLVGKQATLANVLRELNRLAVRTGSGDQAVLVLNGHGTSVLDNLDNQNRPARHITAGDEGADKFDYAFACYDTSRRDGYSFLLDDEVGYALSRIPARQRFFCVETCSALGPEKSAGGAWRDAVPPARKAASGGAKPGATIVLSSSRHQYGEVLVSPDGKTQIPFGPVSYFLWSAVTAGGDSDSGLSYRAVERYVKSECQRRNLPADPDIYASEGAADALNGRFLGGSVAANSAAPLPLRDREGKAVSFAHAKLRPTGIASALRVATERRGDGDAGTAQDGKIIRAALAIGCNQTGPNSGLSRLLGAENDAVRVHENLQRAGYYSVLMVPTGPESLTPTRAHIVDQISQLQSQGFETLVLYASLHGITGGSGEAYLMAQDSRADEPALTGLSLRDLARLVRKAGPKMKRFILITDACALGVDRLTAELRQGMGEGPEIAVLAAVSKDEKAFERPPLTSASTRTGDAEAPESHEWHGLFSSFLVEATYGTRRPRNEKGGPAVGETTSAPDGAPMNPATIAVEAPADRDGNGVISLGEAFEHARALVIQWPAANPDGGGPAAAQRPTLNVPLNASILNEPFGPARLVPVRKEAVIAKEQIRSPRLDAQRRMWVYRDMHPGTMLPFRFSHWMFSDEAMQYFSSRPKETVQMMSVDLRAPRKTATAETPASDAKPNTFIEWRVAWTGKSASGGEWAATWAALGGVYWQDNIPWWAEPGDNRGLYYDMRGARSLNFRVRSGVPGQSFRVKVKIGFLSHDATDERKPLGDSVKKVIESRWFEASEGWANCVLPIPEGEDMSRIASFCFVLERKEQHDPDSPVVLQIDDVNFAFDPLPTTGAKPTP